MTPKQRAYLFTSESVGEGHPDKVADTISDAVLDACLSQDKFSRVACETYVKSNVAIIGGDTNTWDHPLAISITALGIPHAKGAVRRGGAKPHDAILVTGTLGGSMDGRHLDFTPRLTEAKALLDRYELHSMIDLSDGLATDLRHICQESGCGALLDAEAMPLSPGLIVPANNRTAALKRALSDGEDFELCMTVAPQTAARILMEQHEFLGIPITRIGSCTAEQGIRIRAADGTVAPLEITGYEHGF